MTACGINSAGVDKATLLRDFEDMLRAYGTGGRRCLLVVDEAQNLSLPALEEPFARQYPPTADGPRVAVEGVETDGGRRIVLFSTEPLNLRDANAKLMEEGFRGVMRLDEVRQIEKIPVLGTGKTDYKVLLAMIQK